MDELRRVYGVAMSTQDELTEEDCVKIKMWLEALEYSIGNMIAKAIREHEEIYHDG